MALPTAPVLGEIFVIVGCVKTVKGTPLLGSPLTVTMTFPDAAPAGTGTLMELLAQLVGTATSPLNVTVLFPCVAPKLEPVILTEAPGKPELGDTPVMFGLVTVKITPLLLTPPAAATTTLPDVAAAGTKVEMLLFPQELTVAATPLNVTLPLP